MVECSINGTLHSRQIDLRFLELSCYLHLSSFFFLCSSPTGPALTMEGRNVPDCTSCKLVGATGCFAGAAYAMYERAKIPAGNKNRVWLAVISVGGYPCEKYYTSCPCGAPLDAVNVMILMLTIMFICEARLETL